jgi:membrane protein CcdC involved in cytochrome C biogenesis
MRQRGEQMRSRGYCVLSGVLFSLVAIAHLLRIVYSMSIQVDEVAVPMLVSWFGMIVPAALAIWAFRIARGSRVA